MKTGYTREEVLHELTADNPQGRLIRLQEVAETVGRLCLPSSARSPDTASSLPGGLMGAPPPTAVDARFRRD